MTVVIGGNGNNNMASLWTWPWSKSSRTLSMTTIKQRSLLTINNKISNRNGGRAGKSIIHLISFFILSIIILFWRADNESIQISYLTDVIIEKEKDREPATSIETKTNLAVLVAGSTQRFLFHSFVDHVIKPCPSNVSIDYFAILTMKSGPAFRQEDGYMGHLVGRDKMFENILLTTADQQNNNNHIQSVDVVQNSMIEVMTKAIEENKKSRTTTTTTAATATANVRALRLLEEPIEDDPILVNVRIREFNKEQQENNSNTNNNQDSNKEETTVVSSSYDLYQQFPMMDLRPKAFVRTKAGNKNMVRLFLALESLYKTEFLDYERSQKMKERIRQQQQKRNSGQQLPQHHHQSYHYYDYVLILRDDTLWLEDFDLNAIINSDPTADAYILSCDGRTPTMLEPEMNDHGILIRRDKADIVGKYISSMAKADLHKCHHSVEPWLGKERGCNSEMILKFILQEVNNLKIKLISQSLLPFQRSVLIQNDDTNNNSNKQGDDDDNDYYCYHKFCQSMDNPLQLPNDIKKCKELKFEAKK